MPSLRRRARIIAQYQHARANYYEARRALSVAQRTRTNLAQAFDNERAAWRVLRTADDALGITVTDAERVAIGRACALTETED
jgi:hypothetical protein